MEEMKQRITSAFGRQGSGKHPIRIPKIIKIK